MKLGWTIFLHALGVACIASAIGVIATLGQGDWAWTAWSGVLFFWVLAVGVAMGWFRLRRRPLTIIALGFYVMAAITLLGVGYPAALGAPTLFLAFAPLATALVGRMILLLVARVRKPGPPPG